MSTKRYVGLMSGTSLDGIDTVLCQIDAQGCYLEEAYFLPFDQTLKGEILEMIEGQTTLQEVGRVDVALAKLFAQSVEGLLDQAGIPATKVSAIGSHGQTLWHEPKGKFPFSMQLGNPSVLAVESGIDVVADFRAKDIALGGQGAPFAPVFHHALFGHIPQCGVLNIGGMANLSVFEPLLIGYDVGCGNVLMDLWINEVKGEPFDRDGAWAASGEVHQALLSKLLEDHYFKLNFPKSTGREYFNKSFLRKYLEQFAKIASEDIQATLLAVTAHAIANEIKKFDIKRVLVCGGGAKNTHLMSTLSHLLPDVDVDTTEREGVSSDNIEAMIFAWLAHKRLRQEPIALKTVTGAKKNTILGGIYASD